MHNGIRHRRNAVTAAAADVGGGIDLLGKMTEPKKSDH